MTFLLILAVGVLLAVALKLTILWLRRHRMEAELREDWWPRFEREFRAYTSQPWHDARHGEGRG